MVNEAAILTARRNKTSIGQDEFEEAVERVLAGPERRSRIISAEEKQIIAYHEAGHALVMSSLEHCDPVHKVSIIARGMALGYTMPLPEDDRYLQSKAKFRDDMAGLLGGRSAEEIIYQDVTTGASNDLERATKIAPRDGDPVRHEREVGATDLRAKEELVFLGREIGEQRNYSEGRPRGLSTRRSGGSSMRRTNGRATSARKAYRFGSSREETDRSGEHRRQRAGRARQALFERRCSNRIGYVERKEIGARRS